MSRWRTSRRPRAPVLRRNPWRANAATTSSASPSSRPGHDQPLRRALDPRGDLEQQRPHEVGEHGRRPRPAPAAGRSGSTSIATPLRGARAASVAGDRRRARCRTPAPGPSQARRRDREDARAAAPVGERAPPAPSLSSSSVSRVVGCEPVPNACPGSITRPARPRGPAPTARRTRSGADVDGRWNARQRSSSRPGARSWRPPLPRRRGSTPRRAGSAGGASSQDGNSTASPAWRVLASPAGTSSSSSAEHHLRVRPRDPHRHPDHSSTMAAQGPRARAARARRMSPQRELVAGQGKPEAISSFRPLLHLHHRFQQRAA